MTNPNEDVEATKFRQKVRPRDGEWNFDGFYQRTTDTPPSRDALLAASMGSIVDGTHREMRFAHMRDMMGVFIGKHESCLSDHADFLTARMNSSDGYAKSPIVGVQEYKAHMNSYIDALRKAVSDFKKISDPLNQRGAQELMRSWEDDPKLCRKLDEALRYAADPKDRDLHVLPTVLADRIKAASSDYESIAEGFKKIATQKQAAIA